MYFYRWKKEVEKLGNIFLIFLFLQCMYYFVSKILNWIDFVVFLRIQELYILKEF